MGLIKQGILGGFRKKTGTVVGAYWRSLDVIRGLPRSSGKAPTQKQLMQQAKFGLVTGFLSNFSALIDRGFGASGEVSTPMNVAVAWHLKNAVIGDYPDYEIDLSMLRFSNGKLEMPAEFLVEPEAGGVVNIGWSHTEADDKYIDGTDSLSVLVYNTVKSKFMRFSLVAPRSAKTYSLQLPASFVGDAVQIYVAFSSTIKAYTNSDSANISELTVV
ncbi:DUF6266 family protein [Pedobacter sp. BMA]|uniref:DUF6266 family protein n=1 Tax=Pedobacter sp. BMA TaxID=1663685 RepID=UPI00069DD772|nr:DUF6266 family protein [Pedobacter sp. BMA]